MSKANPSMKAEVKKPAGVYNSLVKVRCPKCDTKYTIYDGKDLGCPNGCKEGKTNVVDASELDNVKIDVDGDGQPDVEVSVKPAGKKAATKKSTTKESN